MSTKIKTNLEFKLKVLIQNNKLKGLSFIFRFNN